MDLNWLAPIAQTAQPLGYAMSSWVEPVSLALSVASATASMYVIKAQQNFVLPQWGDAVPNWGVIPRREATQTNYAPFIG